MDYQEFRDRFASALEASADSHEAGQFFDIDSGYDELDATLPRNDDPRYRKLHIALVFWDSWIDARNHDFLYYDIDTPEWPLLARTIALDLREDREITDARVLTEFDLSRRRTGPSFWTRVKRLFSRNASL